MTERERQRKREREKRERERERERESERETERYIYRERREILQKRMSKELLEENHLIRLKLKTIKR